LRDEFLNGEIFYSLKEATVNASTTKPTDTSDNISPTSSMPTTSPEDFKTLKGLTPYEYICSIWTKEPQRFTLNPTHLTPGPNI